MIQGSIASLVTPFRQDLSLDSDALSKEAARLVQHGFDALCFAGGTGEFLSLSDAEREQGLKAVLDASGGTPVVAATLLTDPTEILRSGERCARAGAAAIMVMPPYFYAPSQAAIIDFLSEVAKNAPLPVIVFNSAARGGRTMDVETIVRLAGDHRSLVAVKETTESVENIERLVAGCRPDFKVIQAHEALVLSSYVVGATGSFGSLCNIIPRTIVALHHAIAAGGYARARRLNHAISRLSEIAYSTTIPVGIKHIMMQLGASNGLVRRPLRTSVPEGFRAAVDRVVQSLRDLESDPASVERPGSPFYVHS